MEQDLETTLVHACTFLRQALGSLPVTIESDIALLEQAPSPETRAPHLEHIYNSAERIRDILTETRAAAATYPDAIAVASLRHDLNSSLTILLGNAELWQEDPSNISCLEGIKTGVAQLEMWLHIDTEEDITVGNLLVMVEQFSEKEMKEKKIIFDRHAGYDLVRVIPSFTVRRFYQTVRNAVKACLDTTKPYTITMRPYREGDYCVIEISDHGIGVYPSVVQKAAQTAGILEEQPTLYDTICQIFRPGVSGFKEMKFPGQGDGLNSSALAAQRGKQDVTLETTIYDPEGTLITINKEHPHGYVDPTKTTTGTTFRYYLPLAKRA